MDSHRTDRLPARPRFLRLPRRSRLPHGRLVPGVLAAAVVAALVVTVPGEESTRRACDGVTVKGWRTDDRMTAELARYADDNTRLDDWTGGDGSRSVRLPDGRILWMSADTFLDEVHGGRSRAPGPVWVRNAGLVLSSGGTVERTLLGEQQGRNTALFAGTATEDGREVWRWPVQAVVEPRGGGAGEQVVRVLLWQREAGSPPWVFGVPRATEVATLSLPDLKLESLRTVHSAPGPEVDRRVLYGTSAVTRGGWTYVFGADEGSVDGGPSRAHVARVPVGRLAEADAWRYWSGDGWRRDPARSAPILVGKTPNRGATGTYSVVRHGDSWLLLTMDAGGPDGQGLSDIVSYWSCSPTGPWHGPSPVAKPPLPPGGPAAGAVPYNPQGHPAIGPGGELLVSYDVNVLGDPAAIHRDVELYRPRFLRLQLGPG
ncbi:DUF4185 domain-containing protein [Streptomyces sp. HNM0574]|uniref:DUF4185 domain-containing protein n=1 Tax=Streptomyces sp. HNM0574 TaxID=2714954 RepID=UPI00146D9A88|nr:DUF4185 domain-containing protein [Streptomyces sp. HNM0574]NLU66440.1 DUF4185 domain-containing protein [Streptomyces sp. HNM0574]